MMILLRTQTILPRNVKATTAIHLLVQRVQKKRTIPGRGLMWKKKNKVVLQKMVQILFVSLVTQIPDNNKKIEIVLQGTKRDKSRSAAPDKWSKIGHVMQQRNFIASNMQCIQLRYRYPTKHSKRHLNNAFHFEVQGEYIRVCKQFSNATLDINDRPIRTVILKKAEEGGFVPEKGGFVQKIAAGNTKFYIDGGISVADLHRDYVNICKNSADGHVDLYGNYVMYLRISTEEYSVSFFSPKKDQCEMCQAFTVHILEKYLSRAEKANNKEMKSDIFSFACYDLQAALACPKVLAKLGHVFQNLLREKKTNEGSEFELTFYSDNCCGWEKIKALKSGPIFHPDHCISLIQTAKKKGNP
ncbi:hypothetical protein PR048_010959 [Dryococelus australis]|uniref:Uncharacterized protein n=1 Tax=Dryococelus australis TaxID=614101 RepID=A0ABQ9HKA0_9NEOP|nr:hypothetical protein PR048_010959 [Dryococelus australis]